MRRREFIAVAGSAAMLLPSTSHAESPSPTIGFLNPRSPDKATSRAVVAAFQQGIGETGFVENQNVDVEYRWAEDRLDRLPELAADLVQRNVAVIVAAATDSVRAAMAATKTIPIVFTTANDPIQVGFVSSLSRPTGNVTGVSFYSSLLAAKRIELLNELLPNAAIIGFLVNPGQGGAATQVKDFEATARGIGKVARLVPAGSPQDLEVAFAGLAQLKISALLVAVDPLFDARPERVATLAASYRVPTIFYTREFVQAGGLMSYGAELTDAYRQAGVYAGQILKGAKPADLPVVQPTRFQLVVNRPAAAALGITLPQSILLRADEVIE